MYEQYFLQQRIKSFYFEDGNSEYQLQVGDYGILHHLYYGAPVADTELSDLLIYAERGFSGNPYERWPCGSIPRFLQTGRGAAAALRRRCLRGYRRDRA